MASLLDKIKEYVNDVAYNVKKVLPLKDDLDKIIESEYEKAFEILDKYIEYIKREYGIDYKIPRLEISEDESSYDAWYLPTRNEICFFKESIEEYIDNELKFLGYKEINDIEYLNNSIGSKILLYPSYINKKNKRESIAESITRLVMFHEFWHSIDFSILDKLEKDPTIKNRYYLLTILNDRDNIELRASAFEVVMYYLANGFHKHKNGYVAAYANIPICRTYIEKIDILEKNKNTKEYVPYGLGFCYGNIVVAKYGSSLKENIYKIIDDIIHLNKEKAIDVIKLYGDNPDKLLHDKNSNSVI